MSVYHVLFREVSYYVWAFYACFLRGAFSLFSSVAFLFRSLVFLRFFLLGISDQIRSLVSFGGSGCSAVETPRLMLVSSVVSFGGRGARLWRHPG